MTKSTARKSSRSSAQDQVALLVNQTEGMSIDDDIDSDDSVVVLPQKKTRAGTNASVVSSTSHTGADGKKKKRYV